jgi:hypothetical protein
MDFSAGFMWKYIGICKLNKECFPSLYSKNNNNLTVSGAGTGILLVHYMCVFTTSGAVLFGGGSFTG